MSRVLLLEDDPILGKSLKLSLELEGYEVAWARDLKGAHAQEQELPIDLFLLDWNLPDGVGLDFCRQLREKGSIVPVIFLTAKSEEESAIKALDSGADDYVRKPFNQNELFARIRSALREVQVREPQHRYGDLLVLMGSRKVFYNREEIDLNRREFDIFVQLVKKAESVVSRDDLLMSVDKEGEIFDRTIDSHLSHIRSKLKKAKVTGIRIASVYGVGYRLEREEP